MKRRKNKRLNFARLTDADLTLMAQQQQLLTEIQDDRVKQGKEDGKN